MPGESFCWVTEVSRRNERISPPLLIPPPIPRLTVMDGPDRDRAGPPAWGNSSLLEASHHNHAPLA